MRNFKRLYIAGFVVGGLVLIGLWSKSSFSQTSNSATSEIGRYQLVTHSPQGADILIDTKTGRIWRQETRVLPRTMLTNEPQYETKWVEDGPFLAKVASK